MAVIEYSAELQEAAATVVPEGCEVSPAAQELAAIALNDIDQRYGETSENPQAHHNAEHSLDVIRRGIRLTNILYPYINEHHQTDIYDLVTLAGQLMTMSKGRVMAGMSGRVLTMLLV